MQSAPQDGHALDSVAFTPPKNRPSHWNSSFSDTLAVQIVVALEAVILWAVHA